MKTTLEFTTPSIHLHELCEHSMNNTKWDSSNDFTTTAKNECQIETLAAADKFW